jgi:hypothetical protein
MSELYFRDGTIKAVITGREARLMPLNRARQNDHLIAYHDWFESCREAKAFCAEVLAAKDDQAEAGVDVNYLLLVRQTTDSLFALYMDAENNGKAYKTYSIGRVLQRRGKTYEDYKGFLRQRNLLAADDTLKGVVA